jgi:hypothetical protein
VAIGLYDGEVPGILTPEDDFWPWYVGGCRINDPDGTVPEPPAVPYDIVPGSVPQMALELYPFNAYWSVGLLGPVPEGVTPWGFIAPAFSENIPNTTYSGIRGLLRPSGQTIFGPSVLPENTVTIPWDFSNVRAVWGSEDGKIREEFVCTGWGFFPDKWDGAASDILFSSSLTLVLSRV